MKNNNDRIQNAGETSQEKTNCENSTQDARAGSRQQCSNGKPNRNDRRDGKHGARVSPEEWWAGASPSQKSLAQQIGMLIPEVSESKRIEIRLEREAIRARFIHILKQPEPGCVSAIVLPEVTTKQWN